MPDTVLILGGGIGGIATANALRRRLPRGHRILVVDREPAFALAASFLWVMTGDRTPRQVSRPLDRLGRRGVEVVHGEVERIAPSRVQKVWPAAARPGIGSNANSAPSATIYSAEPGPVGVAGPEESAAVRGMVARTDAAYHPEHQVVRLEGRQVEFTNSVRAEFDLLVYVPPIRPPQVLSDSG